MITKKFWAAAVLAALAATANAGPATNALGACLADNTTGRERKDLARWIHLAMSMHPDLLDLSRAPGDARDAANRKMATLLTRLLADNCATQARAAMAAEGTAAIQGAFGKLGELAMLELTSNADVAAAIRDFERHIDRKRLEEALAPR